MVEKEFDFITQKLQIPGTSYSLQVGFLGDIWISRILKGENIIASNKFENIEGPFPNQNEIVNWVLRTVAVPDLNPHKIMKTVQTLAKDTIKEKERYDIKHQKLAEESSQKSGQIHKKQTKFIKEKLNFLDTIKTKIENGATGNEILKEYNNYPRHFAGILRLYDSKLKEIGDKKIINAILKERNSNKKYTRLDSVDAYLKIIKTEKESVKNQLQQFSPISH